MGFSKKTARPVFLALLCVLLPLGAAAAEAAPAAAMQSDAEIMAKLDTVVVSASGYEQDIFDAPASISIITREELEKRPFNNLADAIKSVPGVSYNGSSGNERDITIRGLPGEYTLILVDGKRQSSRQSRNQGSGGYEASYIPPLEAIDRIEVIRGPMSTLYGSDAMGGVINIITRKNEEKWRGAVSLDHTFQEDSKSGDISNGNFFVGGPLIPEKLSVQIMGWAHLRAEDKIEDGYNESNNKSATGKVFFTPWDKHEFIAEAGRTTQKREAAASKSGTDSNSDGTRDDLYNWSHRNNWALSYNADWDVLQHKFSVYQEQSKSFRSSQEQKITNTVVDGMVTMPLPRNMLSLGGQYQYSELKGTSVTGTTGGGGGLTGMTSQTEIDAYQYAFFIEDELAILEDILSLTAGIRMDEHEHFGDYWSPRAYLVYHPLKDFTVKGGVAKGFRAPELKQMDPGYGYSTQKGRAVMYGDPDLEPETSVNYELGVTYHNDYGIIASITGFRTDFKNKITNYNTGLKAANGLSLFKHANVDKARNMGIEAGLTIPLPYDLKLISSYTYTKSEIRENNSGSGGGYKGDPLTQTPKHAANARLEWQATEALSFYTQVDYTGTQAYAGLRNGNGGNLRFRSAFTTADLGGSWQINENTRLNFAVLNVFDKWDDDPTDATGEDWSVIDDGRRYWVGLTVTF